MQREVSPPPNVYIQTSMQHQIIPQIGCNVLYRLEYTVHAFQSPDNRAAQKIFRNGTARKGSIYV